MTPAELRAATADALRRYVTGDYRGIRPEEVLVVMVAAAKAYLAEHPADGPRPIDVVLPCPRCGTLHVDAPEPESDWTNPPHRSHLCHSCGYVWRPADVPTNGVAAVKTRGEKDSPADDGEPVTWGWFAELLPGIQIASNQAVGDFSRRLSDTPREGVRIVESGPVHMLYDSLAVRVHHLGGQWSVMVHLDTACGQNTCTAGIRTRGQVRRLIAALKGGEA